MQLTSRLWASSLSRLPPDETAPLLILPRTSPHEMLRLARPVEPTTSRVIALIGIACLGLPTGLMNGRSSSAELYVLDARHDVTMQIADVEDLVQKGGDTLPLNPTNSGGIEGAAQIAKQAGGVVVAVEAQADGPIDAFVGSETTKLVGEELARVFGAAR